MTKRIESTIYEDRIIRCAICGDEFGWTADEQYFYEAKELSEPKRCQPCREKRKAHFAQMELSKHESATTEVGENERTIDQE